MQHNNGRTSITPDDIKEQLSDPALIRMKIELRSARQRLHQQQALAAEVQQLKRYNEELQRRVSVLYGNASQAADERNAAEDRLAKYKNIVRLANTVPQKQADTIFAELLTIATDWDANFSTNLASYMQDATSSQKSGISQTLEKIYQQIVILRYYDTVIFEHARAAQPAAQAYDPPKPKVQPGQTPDEAFLPEIRLLQNCVDYYTKSQKTLSTDCEEPKVQSSLLSFLVSQVSSMFRALLKEVKTVSGLRYKLAVGYQTQEALTEQIDALREVLDQQAEQIERLCAIPRGEKISS